MSVTVITVSDRGRQGASGVGVGVDVSSTPYAVTRTDGTIRVDATTGNKIVNPPPTADNIDRVLRIKKMDNTTFTVTINADIDGGVAVLTVQFESITIQSNGINWDILA